MHKKAHYGYGECTKVMVGTDIEALGHYWLAMVLLIEHNPHELIMVVMILPRPLSDPNAILEDY